MVISEFAIGDYFYTTDDAGFVQVKDISCAKNHNENRWETEVLYDEIMNNLVEPNLVKKAADFVRMIQEDRFTRTFKSVTPLIERKRGKYR